MVYVCFWYISCSAIFEQFQQFIKTFSSIITLCQFILFELYSFFGHFFLIKMNGAVLNVFKTIQHLNKSWLYTNFSFYLDLIFFLLLKLSFSIRHSQHVFTVNVFLVLKPLNRFSFVFLDDIMADCKKGPQKTSVLQSVQCDDVLMKDVYVSQLIVVQLAPLTNSMFLSAHVVILHLLNPFFLLLK